MSHPQTNPNSLANLQKGTELSRTEAQAKKTAFIEALHQLWPNITKAAQAIGVSRSTVFQWRIEDKELAKQWDAAEQAKLDRLEENVVEVGLSKGGAGYAFPVLKAYRRETWGEKLEHSGNIGTINLTHSVPRPTKAVNPAGELVETDTGGGERAKT